MSTILFTLWEWDIMRTVCFAENFQCVYFIFSRAIFQARKPDTSKSTCNLSKPFFSSQTKFETPRVICTSAQCLQQFKIIYAQTLGGLAQVSHPRRLSGRVRIQRILRADKERGNLLFLLVGIIPITLVQRSGFCQVAICPFFMCRRLDCFRSHYNDKACLDCKMKGYCSKRRPGEKTSVRLKRKVWTISEIASRRAEVPIGQWRPSSRLIMTRETGMAQQ